MRTCDLQPGHVLQRSSLPLAHQGSQSSLAAVQPAGGALGHSQSMQTHLAAARMRVMQWHTFLRLHERRPWRGCMGN